MNGGIFFNGKAVGILGCCVLALGLLVCTTIWSDKTSDYNPSYENRGGKIAKLYIENGCRVALVQDKVDTLQYMKLSSCDQTFGDVIGEFWFKNHHEGDSVHFERVDKSRYFKLQPSLAKN
ncbi:MAG: hypothetical protein JWM20_913 [Patescibacteria group bacterium]|nr:hypothetical protein [Patescibacteria group bacterium]